MNRADAEEYTEALGQVVAGGWRQVALGKRLGVPDALGITTEAWVEDKLGGYVRLSIPDRREAVAELTEEGLSTREIGDVLGVNHDTVAEDRKAVGNPTPELREEKARVDVAVGNPTPEPEPQPEPLASGAEPPAADDLADENVRLRRSKARKMLANAAAATSELSPSVDVIAEAVISQGTADLTSERQRIERNRQVWERLLSAVDEQASPQLRRVK